MTLLYELSASLGLPMPFINGIARKASHAYKDFQIPKRSGGMRDVAHPARPLKALQRWLLRHVIGEWPVHDAVFGYVKGRSIQLNARRHAESRYLLRMDFESFFPSITARDVSHYLGTTPPGTAVWTDDDRRLFVQLVTREERLTIGAPTSPALSNALCYDLDRRCALLAADRNACYTRYADDMFFSAKAPNVLRDFPSAVADILSKIDIPAHLRVNATKERHSSRKGRRQVTGIVLTSEGRAVMGRTRKRFIRRQIHQYKALSIPERASLRGLISFAADVEANFINDLILKYGRDAVMAAWKG